MLEYIDIIDLKVGSHTLGSGYERGHIFGKFYKRGNIPDNQTFVQDLKALMKTYETLRDQLSYGFKEMNQRILDDRLI